MEAEELAPKKGKVSPIFTPYGMGVFSTFIMRSSFIEFHTRPTTGFSLSRHLHLDNFIHLKNVTAPSHHKAGERMSGGSDIQATKARENNDTPQRRRTHRNGRG